MKIRKLKNVIATSLHCVLFTMQTTTDLAAVACNGLELFIANDVTVHDTINNYTVRISTLQDSDFSAFRSPSGLICYYYFYALVLHSHMV